MKVQLNKTRSRLKILVALFQFDEMNEQLIKKLPPLINKWRPDHLDPPGIGIFLNPWISREGYDDKEKYKYYFSKSTTFLTRIGFCPKAGIASQRQEEGEMTPSIKNG